MLAGDLLEERHVGFAESNARRSEVGLGVRTLGRARDGKHLGEVDVIVMLIGGVDGVWVIL